MFPDFFIHIQLFKIQINIILVLFDKVIDKYELLFEYNTSTSFRDKNMTTIYNQITY